MVKSKRLEVDPESLNDWMLDKDNKKIMHSSCLEGCKYFISGESEDNETVKLMEFVWENETYAQIYIHKDNMSTILESVENFFVEEDLFEEAIEVRDLRKDLG